MMLHRKTTIAFIFGVFATQASAAQLSAECKGGTVESVSGTRNIAYKKGGNTELVYTAGGNAAAISGCGVHGESGVVVFFHSGDDNTPTGAYYSPDCRNVGGSGKTEIVYNGEATKGVVETIAPYKTGVVTKFRNNVTSYYSPDCRNVGGGGKTKDHPF